MVGTRLTVILLLGLTVAGCFDGRRVWEGAASKLLTLLAVDAGVDRELFSKDETVRSWVRQDLYRDLESLDSGDAHQLAVCIVGSSNLSGVRKCRSQSPFGGKQAETAAADREDKKLLDMTGQNE